MAWASLSTGSRFGATQALRQTLDRAVQWGLIEKNPAKLAGPNPQPKRTEIVPFEREELDRICGELGPDAQVVRFAAASGLRPCEWIPLTRRDVDRKAGVVLVERSHSRGALRAYGKTAGSRRRVPLSASALAALDAVTPTLSTTLLFPAIQGGMIDLHNWRRNVWRPALIAAGVEHGTVYTLRHTFATRALEAGITLFELSRFMGTSVEMIDRTYGHLASGTEAAAAAKLDALDALAG